MHNTRILNYCWIVYVHILQFQHLFIIKYNKSDAYIAKKLEHWFHGIPITVTLFFGFMGLAMNGYNVVGDTCLHVSYDPPHCIGYEDGTIVDSYSIPCGRGNA